MQMQTPPWQEQQSCADHLMHGMPETTQFKNWNIHMLKQIALCCCDECAVVVPDVELPAAYNNILQQNHTV